MSAEGSSPEHESADVWVVDDGRAFGIPDRLAIEEPLEIRLVVNGKAAPVAVTMRTPGNDVELAAGFLFSEQIVEARDDLLRIDAGVEQRASTRVAFVAAELAAAPQASLARMERHFFASSACGVCGKSDIESLALGKVISSRAALRIDAEVLYELPQRLRAAQAAFAKTGGLHAAGLFDEKGTLIAVREDVGRHNALDKLIGWALLEGRLPLCDAIVVVSGRASYELVQKCSMAEAPVLCAVSAPSSMAVSFARRLGMTLIGFLRERRFNVYAGGEHLAPVARARG